MIRFYFNLKGYEKHRVSEYVERLTEFDRKKLQDGIDTFQKELHWPHMWSVEDAEKRLKEGWWFYVLEKNNKYLGWAWFDVSNKQFCNLYVCEEARNKGYG